MEAITPETINLWGETLCLNLANSVDWSADDRHVDPEHTDVLSSPDHLRRWAGRLQLFEDRPVSAVSVSELARVRALRDAVYHTFSAIARGREPAPEQLQIIWSDYQQAIRAADPNFSEGRLAPAWTPRDERLIRLRGCFDAVALLQDPGRLARVARCPGRDCGWLFINHSGRRRWCSMSACGSREKMRRAYYRHRADD